MKHIIIAAAAAAIIGGLSAPAAQATPLFCEPHTSGRIYITACQGGDGGGGPAPFYAVLRDSPSGKTGNVVRNPNTGRIIKVCRAECHKVAPEDQVLND